MTRRFVTRKQRRSGGALLNVAAVIVILGLLGAFMLPAVRTAREAARRNSCNCNMKQYGVAIHNYHDKHRRFPSLTTTQVRGVKPGSVDDAIDGSAGYSWHVQILPFMEETTLYARIVGAPEGSDPEGRAFAWTEQTGAGKLQPPVSQILGCAICPSYAGPRLSTAPEYAPIVSTVVPEDDSSGCGNIIPIPSANRVGVAISNYVALSATHLACMLDDPTAAGATPPNGCIVPGPDIISLRDITDGTSKTLMIAESREPSYASWYDGTVAWVVGADPNGPQPVRDAATGYWTTSGRSSLGVGPTAGSPVRYLPAGRLNTIAADWSWGPSSDHPGGVVMHLFGDASARGIVEDIDPNLYLHLITRADKESAVLPD